MFECLANKLDLILNPAYFIIGAHDPSHENQPHHRIIKGRDSFLFIASDNSKLNIRVLQKISNKAWVLIIHMKKNQYLSIHVLTHAHHQKLI
jgi:hypothetical protein